MKRINLIIILLLAVLCSFSFYKQMTVGNRITFEKKNLLDTVPTGAPQLFGGKVYEFKNYLIVDSILFLKGGDTLKTYYPALQFKSSDSSWYGFNNSSWRRFLNAHDTLNYLATKFDLIGSQIFATGTSGTDFGINSVGTTHTFNLPTASASNRGALNSTDWSTFNNKQPAGNYITAITGDVAASGPGSAAATIANNAVTNAKAAQMGAHTFKGNNTGLTANASDLTATQLTAELNTFGASLKGLVPPAAASPSSSKYLSEDGTFTIPPGASGITALTGPVTASGPGSAATSIANNAITNAMVDSFYTYPAQSTLGQIWYDTLFTSLQDFIGSGGPTVSLSSGHIAVASNGAAADNAQVWYKKYRATALRHWTRTCYAKIISPSIGFGPGIKSIYSGDHSGFHILLWTNGANKLDIRNESSTTLATGTGPAVSTNDMIRFTITRDDTLFTVTAKNITTNSSVFTTSLPYTLTNGSTLMPNDCYMDWNMFGDNFEIWSDQFISTDVKNPAGVYLIDSKGDYYANTASQRSWPTINTAYPNTVLMASQGGKLAGVYNHIDEIYAMNPEWIAMGDLFRNDKAAGMTDAQGQVMITDLVNKLGRNGSTRVYVFMIPEDTTHGGTAVGLTVMKSWIATQSFGVLQNAVWDSLSSGNVLKTPYDAGDHIHLSPAGHAKLASVLTSLGYLTGKNAKDRTPFIVNDGFILYTGNTIHSRYTWNCVPNYIPRLDTTNTSIISSMLHDDGTTVTISTKPITQVTGVSGALVNIDGALYASGLGGAVGVADRTTADKFAFIAQGGIYQALVNGTGKWFLDVNGLMAVGVNPAITGRSRSIFNIWEDRAFTNAGQLTRGLGFNLDSNTYTGASSSTTANINNASFFPMKIQGTGSTTFTDPATVYIEGAPYAGTSATVLTPWALNINSGNVRLGQADSVGTPTGGILFKDAATGKLGITSGTGVLIKYQHNISTPATGGTVNLVNGQYNIINPSGTIATLTVNLPSSPANNDVVYIKYTQAVTAVTYGNGTVVDGITAPTAGGLVILTYDSGTTSWY